jgi:hypothetical protein
VEPIDVLHGGDRPDHARLVDVVGQRELHEEPVDRVVGIQLLDLLEQLLLGRLRGEPDVACIDSDLPGRLVLEPDVDVRCRIVADKDRREADLPELPNLVCDLAADALGERLAVHELGCH